MTNTFLNRPLNKESDICPHLLELNPEASLFKSTDSGATEVEYLALLASLVGVFKPTQLMETGTWNGDGTASLLTAADPGATVISICHHALSPEVQSGLIEIATERGSELHVVEAKLRSFTSFWAAKAVPD